MPVATTHTNYGNTSTPVTYIVYTKHINTMSSISHVDNDINTLVQHIQRIGTKQSDTFTYTVTFGRLFNDDQVQNTLESLAGTLKAAKKRNIVSYKSELLLQGMSNNEIITLNQLS